MQPKKVDRVKNKNLAATFSDNEENQDEMHVDTPLLEKESTVNEQEENSNANEENFDIDELVEECFEREKIECCQIFEPVIMSHEFDLTYEEEFKIHELMVRREDLNNEMITLYLKIATFDSFENFLMSICRGRYQLDGSWNCFDHYELEMLRNLKQMNGNPIKSCMRMFDGFSKLDETICLEMLEFTLPIRQLLI